MITDKDYKNRLAPRPLDKRAKVISGQSSVIGDGKGDKAEGKGGGKLEYFTAPPACRAIT